MSSASTGAQAADQQLATNAAQNQKFTNSARQSLFGSSDGSNLTGGTLSKFLDPSSLNVSAPTGTYGLQYNKAVEGIAKNSADVRGSLSRYNASRGFGDGPAGFAQDQQRRASEDQTNQQGAAFTDYAGKSYQDALQNFWRASGSLNGEGDSAMSASIGADSAAANNYSNLYGTASTPQPSVLGQVIGGGLQAGGTVGAAAASKAKSTPCPCEGAMILMYDGTEKMSQDVRKGDFFLGEDGDPCPVLETPVMALRPCVEVRSITGRTRVSSNHTFSLPKGGYEFAGNAETRNVKFGDGVEAVTEVKDIGAQIVYGFIIGGSHTYRADKFWALS
jgi:hypothetical protein